MATSQIIPYVQGDLLRGTMSLRLNDACTPGLQDPFQIPVGSVVKIYFPGTSASVVIASNVAVAPEFGGGYEVTIDDAAGGELSYVLIPSKGAGVKLSTKSAPQEVDVVILDSLGAQLQTFQILPPNGIVVTARGNT